VENEIVLIDPQIDRPVILDFHTESRPLPRKVNFVLGERDAQFARFFKNLAADRFGSLPGTRGVLHLLPNVVVELKSSKVTGNVLCSSRMNICLPLRPNMVRNYNTA
jgi:hypothetical protein